MGDYKFLKIEDAVRCINQKVNILAAVVEFSPPVKSDGTDYVCRLKVIDESYHEDYVRVHLFDRAKGRLPDIVSTGDIILLSRVLISIHDGLVYATYKKKYSSFALYRGGNNKSFRPYHESLKFQARKEDEIQIANLRKWLADSKVIEDMLVFNSEEWKAVLLSQISLHKRINMICKVLHICKSDTEEWIAFVWDGTDAPPISIDEKLEEEMQNELCLHMEPLSLSRCILSTFPTFGTILRVLFDLDDEKYIHQWQKVVGKWVKVLNLVCKSSQGLWYGVSTESTKIQDRPNADKLLDEHHSIDDQLSPKTEGLPCCTFPVPSNITGVNCDNDVPFATLMDLLTCRKAKILKFRCAVRFVSVLPCRVEDFRDSYGTYKVRFTLEDATARIHAFVFAEDGEIFFNGYPPADVLRSKVNRLLGVASSDAGNETGAARNPPWVECCLKTQNRKCRIICDTILLDP